MQRRFNHLEIFQEIGDSSIITSEGKTAAEDFCAQAVVWTHQISPVSRTAWLSQSEQRLPQPPFNDAPALGALHSSEEFQELLHALGFIVWASEESPGVIAVRASDRLTSGKNIFKLDSETATKAADTTGR